MEYTQCPNCGRRSYDNWNGFYCFSTLKCTGTLVVPEKKKKK